MKSDKEFWDERAILMSKSFNKNNTPTNKYQDLENQVIELLSITGCGNVLDAIEYIKALQNKCKQK